MNWKMIVGISVAIALIAVGIVAFHSGAFSHTTNASVMDSSGINTQGSHPPSSDAWQIMSGWQSMDIINTQGSHPPSSDAW